MSYQKIIINCSNVEAEAISDALFELEALSVTLSDAADEPIFQLSPNETRLWNSTDVSALYPENTDVEAIIRELKKIVGPRELNYRSEILPEEDWVRKTQAEFPPQFYGDKLCVKPTWCENSDFPGAVLTIDPGLAFGTGTHATTSLCLSWLAENEIQNKIVVDYGCGSGILALAALALGAKKVYATDHDPQALLAIKNNAELNTFASDTNLELFTSSSQVENLKADIVLANILANPLIELSEVLTELVKPEGYLILSGILSHEADRVFAAYEANFKKLDLSLKDNWCRIVLLRRRPADKPRDDVLLCAKLNSENQR